MWLNINDGYEISDIGEVRNRKTKRILKPWKMGKYLGVWLGAGNKYYIYKLVANCFLPQPTEEGLDIDHIDRNKHNNSAINLRFVSRSINLCNTEVEIKPRQCSKFKQHHISIDKNKCFILTINKKGLKHYSYHRSLEMAIETRDKIINSFHNSKSNVPIFC